MSVGAEDQSRLLGFLGFYETSTHDGHLGAILVTNLQGVPQEFRCTHPVKPTTIQKPLYGNTLEPYVGVDLCGVPLVQSVQNKPSLLIVHKDFLLGVRTTTDCPVILVRRAGEAIDVKPSDSTETTPRRERIDSTTGRFQPIILEAHPDFDDDLVSARPTLETIFSYLDPIEPFERMAKAVEVLSKQDKRFQ